MSGRRFLVARNPDPVSGLPFVVRLPLDGGDMILEARVPWPKDKTV